jgi:dihydrofolate reductase
MGTIIVSQNISLDGVVQDPRGDEGLGRGDWLAMVSDRDRMEWSEELLAEASAAEALLLGRGSYEFFAARYPFRTGAMADRFNTIRKYVVSATLDSARDWNN